MNITSIKQAENVLSDYIAIAKETAGKDITVQRMWPLLAEVGNPQDKFKVIHIAGTSGKTSTAYFCAELLRKRNVKVGLTVSPHIYSITERIQINGRPISDDNFCILLGVFLEKISKLELKPSYFEIIIAFSLWCFVEYEVDYAVVETGLGGLHDGTNVFKQSEKVCVLADIGYDHMQVLGNTIEEIAYQKVGIIQPQNVVFCYQQTDRVMNIIKKQTKKVNGQLNVIDDKYEGRFQTDFPLFQQRNWLLANNVVNFIAKRDKFEEIPTNDLQLTQITVPARMQIIKQNNSTIIIDGAHNQQKITALVASFKDRYPNSKVSILLALKKGKDYREVVDLLIPIASNMIFTSFQHRQDIPITSIDPKVLANYCHKRKYHKYFVEKNFENAVMLLIKSKENIKIITGSLYIAGNANIIISDFNV